MALSLLLDANLPPSLVAQLARVSITAVHVDAVGFGSAADEAIVALAKERGDVLATHDLDFTRILAASGDRAPSVIILRLRLPTPATLATAIANAVRRTEDDLRSGALVMVEDAVIRIRSLPVARGQ